MAATPSTTLIAITGGTGFVGRHVIKAGLDAGYRMRALARSPAKLADLAHPNLEILQGALGEKDADLVKDADVVLHLAGLIKAKNRAAFDAVNIDATRELGQHAQNAATPRFILVSSMAARVPQLSDYAASKRGGEDALRSVYGGPLAIIRAPAVFGPGDEATAPFIGAMEKGILPVPGGRHWRSRTLSLVAVQDLALDIITRAVSGDYDGRIVSPANIGALTWPDFADLATEAVGRPVKPLPLPLTLLYPVAAVTSLLSMSAGVGHLTLGKLREFLYEDWSSEDVIQDAAPMQDRLAQTLAAYQSRKHD